ncbi:hypothetical protein G7085_04640 [Tessaracoccus sp. HDW20]|uniref:hypothetical protein n=1 Tax=Tessaracoccus coleopterorum TaxID=2714950 RepID=UPI001E37A272|nr:hypothetical protein [Tessaracoccus coleopterorum]NHB84152.1 hypothetical protein [Tessaracoccus coleopterorum]
MRDNFVGVDGLGLKVVATRGARFAWRDEEPGGLASQSWFREAVESPIPLRGPARGSVSSSTTRTTCAQRSRCAPG